MELTLWDAVSGKTLQHFSFGDEADWEKALAFSSDGKHFLAAGPAGVIDLWDVAAAKRIKCFTSGHNGEINVSVFQHRHEAIILIPYGKFKTAIIWSVETGRQIRVLR